LSTNEMADVMKEEDETTSMIISKLLEMSRRMAQAGTSEVERKQAETEREQLQTRLFEAQKIEAAGALAGRVAHDFSDLLRAIQEYTEKALAKLDRNDPAHQDLQRIERAATKAANLNQQLLIFGREQPLKLVALNINKTIDIVSKMLDRLLGEGIVIETDQQPDLWTVQADAGNIEQVLVNLSVNAREAMPRGGKLVIKSENIAIDQKAAETISDARPGKFVRLSVKDSGIGMAREILARIFEPFFTTKRPGDATGLGLAVVYGIVKQHNGWIYVRSEPGRGTTFEVFLPACADVPEKKEEDGPSSSRVQGNGERILVVDGDQAVRKFAAAALEGNGYVVFEAATAEEAMEIFEREQGSLDLLFADIVLRQKNGLQLVDQLRSQRSGLPVLLSNSSGKAKSRLPGRGKMRVRLLPKPYSVEEMLKAIGMALGIDQPK
jgi:two-component system cell cycle sensor histidine kinase/response regulator CckA